MENGRILLVCVCILSACAGRASAYSFGAPSSACTNLYPGHDPYSSQMMKAPYSIRLETEEYEPGDQITLHLEADPGRVFRGFVVRVARASGDTEEIVGDFVQVSDGGKTMEWLPQRDGFKNCATHKSNAPVERVTLVWHAPDFQSLGDVIISATFLETYDVFWVNVHSAVIRALVAPPPATYNTTVSSVFATAAEPFTLGCGVSKGCLLYPSGCRGDACTHVLTYRPSGADPEHKIDFQMRAPTAGYVSVGFSRDRLMGDDETVSCVTSGDWVSFQHGYSPAYFSTWQRTTNFTNIVTARDGDSIVCSWTQPYVNTLTNVDYSTQPPALSLSTFDLKHDAFFLQLAVGEVKPMGVKVGRHKELPLVSDRKVNLRWFSIVTASNLPLHVQIHAVLGIAAWMFLAGPAITLARFFRKDIFSKQICSIAAWFQFHRALLFLTGLLTAASIILIFAYVQQILYHALVHLVLALIVMGLVIIQVIAGICRPGLDHPNRPAFNWLHRIGGTVTFLTAGATLLSSTFVSTLNGQLAEILRIIFIIWICLQFLFFLFLQVLDSCRNSQIYEMNGKSSMQIQEPEKASGNSTVKAFILVIYFVSNLALTVAAMAFVFIY